MHLTALDMLFCTCFSCVCSYNYLVLSFIITLINLFMVAKNLQREKIIFKSKSKS